ncbi:bifunctional (p)ppGpp synthetase/guanosine-3',5'-bis(diphosphate) 3'-pyrophosphohydrolase [Candidatus Parcubacteria bacterium]|jgi:GTP pyrophosphokinase|nr:MAG: bifunctional (p)ppGpp synthetase/guanosine-3',5'-bis(diphosphate) 3'-pyrophosphohydrolase [Candidatus Parcubacteria bacterium]
MSVLLTQFDPESVVRKAYEFAEMAHKDELRESGEPYFIHCVKVAETVYEWKLDQSSIAAALLHDTVEDTSITNKDIANYFGNEIAFLVEGLTKLETIQYPEKKETTEIENLRRFIISFAKDLRVVLIKLADRLHNMQTISHLSKERRDRLAWETAEIYAPLAYRLGMQKLSGELEDLAFPHIDPEGHAWLMNAVTESYKDRIRYTERVRPMILKHLVKNDIKPITVDARAKRYSSLYKKLLRYEMDLEKIYDLVAFRIIVDTIEECYAVLGVVHKLWAPLPGRIKDYIARPKPNGYRSIHTTVFCVDKKIIEIQIRTQEMHEEAEMGIAAHWAYQQIRNETKKKALWKGVKNKGELTWIEQLSNWQKHFTEPEAFMRALKTDFFKERIFVITPHNDIIDLPVGATPVDFAYRIHTDVGHQCIGAKINKKIVPIDYELKSGDIVEIITQKGKKPSEDWLRFVKTESARDHIKSALRVKSRLFRTKAEPELMEFKIVNQDGPGFLKEVTTVFGDLRINILYLQSQTDHRKAFSIVTIRTEVLPEAKIEKVLLKLRKIPNTKEVTYKTER